MLSGFSNAMQGANLRDSTPKSLWERVRREIEGLIDEEFDGDDPNVVFHLVFIAPLFIGLLVLAHR